MQTVNRVLACCSLILLFLSNCNNAGSPAIKQSKHTEPAPTPRVAGLIDSSKIYLSNGCIVLRRGNDVISEMFSKLNKTNSSFSHCGIAFNEAGKWYVYHSIGGEDNPDERLRKDTYEDFVIPSHNKGFGVCNLGLKTNEIAVLHTIIDSLYAAKVPFDMKFDLKSDDRLYCAEMVYKSIQKATGNDSLFTTTLHQGFEFVSTDNIFVNKQAQILCHINY